MGCCLGRDTDAVYPPPRSPRLVPPPPPWPPSPIHGPVPPPPPSPPSPDGSDDELMPAYGLYGPFVTIYAPGSWPTPIHGPVPAPPPPPPSSASPAASSASAFASLGLEFSGTGRRVSLGESFRGSGGSFQRSDSLLLRSAVSGWPLRLRRRFGSRHARRMGTGGTPARIVLDDAA